MKALLLLLLLATPAMAVEPEVDCSTGGSGLYEQSMCWDQRLIKTPRLTKQGFVLR